MNVEQVGPKASIGAGQDSVGEYREKDHKDQNRLNQRQRLQEHNDHRI